MRTPLPLSWHHVSFLQQRNDPQKHRPDWHHQGTPTHHSQAFESTWEGGLFVSPPYTPGAMGTVLKTSSLFRKQMKPNVLALSSFLRRHQPCLLASHALENNVTSSHGDPRAERTG